MFKGFRDFIMRGNVVDLAVAVIIGGAFTQVINSMVSDIITPMIGLLGGTTDFSALKLGPVTIGKFINAVLSFLIIAAAVYFIVVVPMKKLAEKRKAQEKETQTALPEDVKLLREILEELKKRS
jgi:large conductance mechanosensitive channel